MTVRERTEQWEKERLSPGACRAAESRGRARPLEPCPMRTAFQRDVDRVVYSKDIYILFFPVRSKDPFYISIIDGIIQLPVLGMKAAHWAVHCNFYLFSQHLIQRFYTGTRQNRRCSKAGTARDIDDLRGQR